MKRTKLRQRLPVLITSTVAILLYAICCLKFPAFHSLRVALDLLTNNAFLGVVAVGSTLVILTGGIDLSVGSMVGCTSIMTAVLTQKWHLHPILGMGLTLLFGTLIGLGQGALIAKVKLPPFLVTLAGLFFLRGLGLWISEESMQIDHPFFNKLVEFSIDLPGKASIGTSTIVLVIVLLAGAFLLKQTGFGRSIYAVGGNVQSAELMGVNVARVKIAVYTLSGLLAALGGVLFTLYTSSGNANSGMGLELDAIATVVIGGALLSGGYGSIFGTFLGLLILAMVQTAITFQGTLSSWWTRIVIGALLLIFLIVQRTLEAASIRAGLAKT
jgi:ribose/xylose/arabinose/galactoside ABC-type transport system permease subunit